MNASNATPLFETKAGDVIELVQLLSENNIPVWIDGGWGVDALLEQQTRPHRDVDIAIYHQDVLKLRALLQTKGYREVLRDDSWECNFVLADEQGRQIDVHAFTLDPQGNPSFGVAYQADQLTGKGLINGYPVQCIDAEWMVKFHSGYELDEDDYRDVLALCQRFAIPLPMEYHKFTGELRST